MSVRSASHANIYESLKFMEDNDIAFAALLSGPYINNSGWVDIVWDDAALRGPGISHFTFEVTATGVGYYEATAAEVAAVFGIEGRIVSWQMRQDASDDKATTATALLAADTIDATLKDDDLFAKADFTGLGGGHATDWAVGGGTVTEGFYQVDAASDLHLGIRVATVSGAGNIKLFLTVVVERLR